MSCKINCFVSVLAKKTKTVESERYIDVLLQLLECLHSSLRGKKIRKRIQPEYRGESEHT